MPDSITRDAQSLAQWLSWLESLHPKEIDLGLDRISTVAERLGLLRFNCPVVTVAGTNGKGSGIAALEALYLDASYHVGAYTSPHLLSYNERVRVNGKSVSDEALIQAFQVIERVRQGVSLTYFEFGTLAALYIFHHPGPGSATARPLDLVLLEVGLGGRLDAVNIIDADVALITAIDLDHQALLGDTREQIGLEKAGIMRAGKSVVIGDATVPGTVLQYAYDLGLEPKVQGQHFGYDEQDVHWRWWGENLQGQRVDIDNLAYGQLLRANLAHVIQVSYLLPLKVTEDNIRKSVCVTLPGRQEYRLGQPSYVFDVAHNPQAVLALARYLAALPVSAKVYALMGALNDKPLDALLAPLLPWVDDWRLTVLPMSRSHGLAELELALQSMGVENGQVYASLEDAFHDVILLAQKDDLILVYGSFYTVAGVKRLLIQQEKGGRR
jgi:dihydrofolate synthase/folylpolyglutamate synthase